jgi:uncharacterized protein YcgL (UPF0745 family)
MNDIIEEELKNLSGAPEKLALQLLLGVMKHEGHTGIEKVKQALAQRDYDLSELPPRVASDLVVYLQNAEANQKESMGEVVDKVEKIAFRVGLAILQGLI